MAGWLGGWVGWWVEGEKGEGVVEGGGWKGEGGWWVGMGGEVRRG